MFAKSDITTKYVYGLFCWKQVFFAQTKFAVFLKIFIFFSSSCLAFKQFLFLNTIFFSGFSLLEKWNGFSFSMRWCLGIRLREGLCLKACLNLHLASVPKPRSIIRAATMPVHDPFCLLFSKKKNYFDWCGLLDLLDQYSAVLAETC